MLPGFFTPHTRDTLCFCLRGTLLRKGLALITVSAGEFIKNNILGRLSSFGVGNTVLSFKRKWVGLINLQDWCPPVEVFLNLL